MEKNDGRSVASETGRDTDGIAMMGKLTRPTVFVSLYFCASSELFLFDYFPVGSLLTSMIDFSRPDRARTLISQKGI